MTSNIDIDPKKVFNIVVFIVIYALLILTCSCSPKIRANNKLKRASKLIEQAKTLDPSASIIDTVIVSDTVYIEAVKHDTTFIDKGDTITIQNDRLLIRYKRDTITNEVFIEGECKADTIIRELKVPYEVRVYERGILDKLGIDTRFEKIAFWFIVVVACVLIFYLKVKPF